MLFPSPQSFRHVRLFPEGKTRCSRRVCVCVCLKEYSRSEVLARLGSMKVLLGHSRVASRLEKKEMSPLARRRRIWLIARTFRRWFFFSRFLLTENHRALLPQVDVSAIPYAKKFGKTAPRPNRAAFRNSQNWAVDMVGRCSDKGLGCVETPNDTHLERSRCVV